MPQDIVQPSTDYNATIMAVAASIVAAHRVVSPGDKNRGHELAREEAKLTRELAMILAGHEPPKSK